MYKTTKILIAAMGGEGGGVLCKWLTAVGEAQGCWVHYTYVPGAAQRTGATTYYLEIHHPDGAVGGERPVSTLIPGPGDIDLVLSTEIIEAGRCQTRGFVTKDKTRVISSTHRTYAIAEKSAPGDGRIDHEAVLASVKEGAKDFIGFDMAACAAEAGSIVNSVLFGAVAGSGVLPFDRQAFEAVIGGGPLAKSNLAGFAMGHDIARGERAPAVPASGQAAAELSAPLKLHIPEELHDIVAHGYARVSDYQSRAYADLYFQRLKEVVELAGELGDQAHGLQLSREVARWLCRLMCYDDVVRVADLKSRRARFARIRETVRLKPGELIYVQDFLKPRAEEIASIMPPWLAMTFLAVTRNSVFAKHGRPLKLKAHTVSGYVSLRMLAGMKWLRPHSHRFAEESANVETWLSAVKKAARQDYRMGVEMAGLARLIKGYGPTHCRSQENFRAILERWDALQAPDDLKRLKDAALAEEKGRALARELAAFAGQGAA